MSYGSVNVPGASALELKNVKDLATQLNEKAGIPGGLATLNAGGKLTASQVPDMDHYTKSETGGQISSAVSAHNSSASAHADIRASLTELAAVTEAIELKYSTNIKENAFTATFGDLNSVTVTGVWNAALERIEF